MYEENFEKKELKQKEIDEIVIKAENLYMEEIEVMYAYQDEKDPEFKESLKEDAYLLNLRAITQAKRLGAKHYAAEKMEAVFDCDFDSLEVPEYESYKMN